MSTTLDNIKSALGIEPARRKSNPEEGQEPVNGVQGSGTAGQPFDQGNREDDNDLGGKSALSAENWNPDDAEVTRKTSEVKQADLPAGSNKTGN